METYVYFSSVHDVLVTVERQQLGARLRVPHFARAIVGAGNETVKQPRGKVT